MKNSGLKYLVAIALIINAATLIFFWYNRPPQEGRSGAKPGDLLIKELKMDDQQVTQFNLLRDQHHKAHDSLLQLITNQRQLLYNQKQAANDTILQKIGLLQAEIEHITYAHFMGVRKICTPEQQIQWDRLLEKTVQNILTPKDKTQRPAHER
jgi:periplasmic protein CpxP/Spy